MTGRHRTLALGLLALLGLPGCWSGDLPGGDADAAVAEAGMDAADASPPPAVESMGVTDVAGEPWPADGAPRRPVVTLRVRGSSMEGDPEPALFLEGPPDEDLIDDLSRAPLRKATEARLVPTRIDRVPGRVILRPQAVLTPGASYAIALAVWAGETEGRTLETPWTRELRVARDGSGARPTDAWPADGTAGVPPALPLLAVRFDGEVRGVGEGVSLVTASGEAVAAEVRSVACPTIGWPTGHCVAIAPSEPLEPTTGYRLTVGAQVRDATGASVGPWSAAFDTAAWTPDEPITLVDEPCAIDERPAEHGCVLANDRDIRLRVRARGPVRAWLTAAGATASAVAPRGELRLELGPWPADTALSATLRLVDLAGRERLFDVDFATTPPLAPLYITEIRADPNGPEPHQEYVEVLNSGPLALDLMGFAISDDPTKEGDVIAGSFFVPAGARALLVGDRFDPDHPDDVAVPPGVVLVRVGTSLATAGLTNAGEPLYLRDAEGHRISAAPATPAPRPGTCRVRVVEDGRDGSPGSFDYDAEDGCTPGRPDRIP